MTVSVNLYFLQSDTSVIKTIQRLSEQFDSLKLANVDASEKYNFITVTVKIPKEVLEKLNIQLDLMQVPHHILEVDD